MYKCKIRRFSETGEIIDMTCDHVRENIEAMKKTFRDMNGTDAFISTGRKDRLYDEYSQALHQFLDKCKCESNIS